MHRYILTFSLVVPVEFWIVNVHVFYRGLCPLKAPHRKKVAKGHHFWSHNVGGAIGAASQG